MPTRITNKGANAMRCTSYLRFLGVALAFLILPALAAAQDSVKCESNDGNRQYCGNYNPNQVRLERQISGSPCTDGQTWGVDRNGLWVDRGCRAIFTILTNPGAPGGRRDAGGGVSIWWDPDPRGTWPPRGDWHGGNWGGGGACFYKDRNFGGSFFCLRRGELRESLGNYGDEISSIRVFGRARTTIYDDRNFTGARQKVLGDVVDLRQYSVSQKPGHTWNNRVSSIRVQ
jgi:Protein of unknown function (DUF3011)